MSTRPVALAALLAKMGPVGIWPVLLSRLLGLGMGMAAGIATGGFGPLALAGLAIPRLDLSGYPAAAAGETRWVIQLPGVLPPTADPTISPNPRDWRVEVLVGQLVKADCNQYTFSARLRVDHPQANPELSYLKVSDVGPLASTRMACTPGQPLQERFVARAGKPFVMPYKVSRPIVIYAPKNLQVRWKLWKAETQHRAANAI
ncbi:ecotin family protein [Cyanobium sp. HWJ4-Hawea]|uniref:ecotin family protein n=1 Tax=Cyanobium sp. HWJ4-Hawea TaxID=2823713 RepID=UPI0020CC3C0B|nr:ecotin family protein [Cyanobium sp. HWJ4-Hawea]MCP9809037.1 ecotin family protein [Cyanobium sp. HWJ4-Hawea]